MQLLDSLIDGALNLPDEGESRALIYAYVSFMRTGELPTDLTGAAYAMWLATFPVLENSRKKAVSGSKGGKRTPKQTAKQTAKQNGKQTAKQTDKQNEEKTESERASYQDSSSSSYSYSPSSSTQGDSQVDTGMETPSLEEVKAYFSANCLRGDPELFWATYAAKGWVDGSGMPIINWTAQALRWSRRQVGMDADKPPDSREGPKWTPAKTVPSDEDIERMRAEVERLEGEL